MGEGLSFPVRDTLEPGEFGQRFYGSLHNLCADPRFHFGIILPRSWRAVDVPAEPPQPATPDREIALFRSMDGPQGEVEVSASLLKREMAPADLLMLLFQVSPHEVLGSRYLDSHGGKIPDLLTRRHGPEGPVISRWTATKDGNRLFIVECRCFEEDYS